MYTVAVQSDFVARHYLTGKDFGPEGRLHSHAYRVEARLSGDGLDAYGFLVDIDALAAGLEAVVSEARDRTLNELPEFGGLNPSLEHLTRIFCRRLRSRLPTAGLREIAVTIWEGPAAWAAYTEAVR